MFLVLSLAISFRDFLVFGVRENALKVEFINNRSNLKLYLNASNYIFNSNSLNILKLLKHNFVIGIN